MGAPKMSTPGSKLTRVHIYYFRFSDHRTWSSLSHVWHTFQIWGRSDKNCGCYRGRVIMLTRTQTDRQTYTQVICICPMPLVAFDKQMKLQNATVSVKVSCMVQIYTVIYTRSLWYWISVEGMQRRIKELKFSVLNLTPELKQYKNSLSCDVVLMWQLASLAHTLTAIDWHVPPARLNAQTSEARYQQIDGNIPSHRNAVLPRFQTICPSS